MKNYQKAWSIALKETMDDQVYIQSQDEEEELSESEKNA